jgi:Undecaprenyl-phosphate glucose phosphotransferase
MSDSSALKLLTMLKDPTAPRQSSRQRTRGLLPFRLIGRIVLCSDLVLIVSMSVLTGLAYHLAAISHVGPVETFFGVGALTAVNFAAVLAARGAYEPQYLANFWGQLRETSTVWLLAFFLLSGVAFLLKVTETYSRGATFAFFAAGWCAITVWRLVVSRIISWTIATGGFAQRNTVLLAEEGQLDGASIVDALKHYCYRSSRTFEFSPSGLSSTGGSSQLLKSIEEIIEISRKETIECVFLLVSWDNRAAVEQLMEFLRVLSVPIYLLPDRNVSHFLANRVVNIGTAWTAELKRAPLTAGEQAWKRVLDVLIAVLVLTMLAPMMVLIAVLIKIESRGPILFMQTRNGFNGRPFRICKFRTMFVLEDGPLVRQATRNDRRVTQFGRKLRRASIDELPQLWNVLAGDMSLVGPRPHASAHNSEYEKIIANYAYRYHVKPGLTGWAQVNGLRGETRTVDLMARRVEFDLWYINNWSFWLDFKILLRTLLLGMQTTAY